MLLTDMANGLRSDANKLSKVSDGYKQADTDKLLMDCQMPLLVSIDLTNA